MYQIKQIPEDFQVKELMKPNLENSGSYGYFILKKKGKTTLGVVDELARRLRIKQNRIGFAGLKDRNAVTEQYISIRNVRPEKAEGIALKDAELRFIGYSKDRINLGGHYGNDFAITVRNLVKEHEPVMFIENYFDEQRFSGSAHLVGKAIVKRNFAEACTMLGLECGRDYVGALRKQGIRRLRFFVHAYQAYLFNRHLASHIKKNLDNYTTIPYSAGEFVFAKKGYTEKKGKLIGFLSDIGEYAEILDEEGINPKDFIINQLPELSSEGGERHLFVKVREIKTEFLSDELNNNMHKQVLMFELPKGSYATIVIKKIFSKS